MKESVTYQAIFEEGFQIGRQKARQKELKSMVINLLRKGAEIEMIQKVSGMSIEAIQKLQSENPA